MMQIDWLRGTGGILDADGRRRTAKYDIQIWQAESGIRSGRRTLSMTVEAGPHKLVLQKGNRIELFVTTAGVYEAHAIVKQLPTRLLGEQCLRQHAR
jgi:hypothetical protein